LIAGVGGCLAVHSGSDPVENAGEAEVESLAGVGVVGIADVMQV
jgi:hypothetical protein